MSLLAGTYPLDLMRTRLATLYSNPQSLIPKFEIRNLKPGRLAGTYPLDLMRTRLASNAEGGRKVVVREVTTMLRKDGVKVPT